MVNKVSSVAILNASTRRGTIAVVGVALVCRVVPTLGDCAGFLARSALRQSISLGVFANASRVCTGRISVVALLVRIIAAGACRAEVRACTEGGAVWQTV